ncbi:hypothetical protein [Brevibacillus laterosporus]|uniref:Uncharacterized protein n=1 Tax=Brevibacillus laterosporus TaxID=1465 RepID=A0AAP3GBN4_BRELA|nr:hypothetical protein [Brevibacillus laterosporus]MCR8981257.1 hypothetical protein [Brevibacillus laterosporus]MCZ0808412.1 hypothetical protein [Brevibacillus laterosporus]MCZ0826871.1 hypothetical protein [Brevibacillus laterosporus]MCZ0850582.1 hypothetical protein [Brevibacillus laterosporus]
MGIKQKAIKTIKVLANRGVAKSFDTVMKQVKIVEENGDWTWVDFDKVASVV